MLVHEDQAPTLDVYGEAGSAHYTAGWWPRLRFRGVRPRRQRPPQRGVHAIHRSLRAFRAWVLADEPFLIPAPAALPALAAVEAIYRAARSGRAEEVTAVSVPQPSR